MSKKIGAITVARNAAKYIVPHLKMYTGVDRNVVLYVDNPIKSWRQHYPEAPDNTLELIAKHCPEVEVFYSSHNDYDGQLMNEMLAIMSDCDYVIHFHGDVLMNQTNWLELLAFLQDKDEDVWKLNMPKCHISYYYDFDHGVRDCKDIEPVISKPTVRYSGFYDFHGSSGEIDWLETHHFNGWKGVTATKEWIENRIQTESNVFASDLEREYGGWIKCPNEIKELFNA